MKWRKGKPIELKAMIAHCGVCDHCKGLVKMGRMKDRTLNPNHCWCLQCGQPYYMKIIDLRIWEQEQWEQKAAKLSEESSNESPDLNQ